ncbi:MAG: nucleoside 2-deoxyribosyltransferase domain-containing protein [Candidatus Pacearchaeota archaeon]|jgi:nucleoside 2-deoxyribosyltransferase
MEKIKVYLSARIAKEAHEWNERVCNSLNYPISVFMPQKHNPWNLDHEKLPKEVREMDMKAMKEADICLLLPPYGRDCAWEIGWFSNTNKLIVIFVENETEWLRDWMLKGAIDYAITNDSKTWKKLTEDPILKDKEIIYINEIKDLKKVLIKIFNLNFTGGY